MPKSKITTEEEKTLNAILTLSGVADKEAKLYWILLNHGILTGTEIIEKSGFKRGNTYALLHQLKKKGLVTDMNKDKKTYFQPEPPQKVLDLLERKSEETDQAKNFCERIMPQLSSRYKMAVGKPVVRYLEGEKGIIDIFKGVYRSFQKVVWGCVDPDIMPTELRQNLVLKKLMPLRVKNNVKAMTLFPDENITQPRLIEEPANMKTVFLINKTQYPLPCQIDAWDDKVSFISFRKNNMVGAVVDNQDFSTTIQSLFKLCFDLLLQRSELEKKHRSSLKSRQ